MSSAKWSLFGLGLNELKDSLTHVHSPLPLFLPQVYIESLLTSNCIQVQPGDRFGIHIEDTPGAVAYTFDASGALTMGYTNPDPSAPIQVDQVVTFDSLTFPYDFSVKCFYDKGKDVGGMVKKKISKLRITDRFVILTKGQ